MTSIVDQQAVYAKHRASAELPAQISTRLAFRSDFSAGDKATVLLAVLLAYDAVSFEEEDRVKLAYQLGQRTMIDDTAEAFYLFNDQL